MCACVPVKDKGDIRPPEAGVPGELNPLQEISHLSVTVFVCLFVCICLLFERRPSV